MAQVKRTKRGCGGCNKKKPCAGCGKHKEQAQNIARVLPKGVR